MRAHPRQGSVRSPQVKALSIIDNAGANPALSADTLVHFACKDIDKNFMDSRACTLARRGIRKLLVTTGGLPDLEVFRDSEAGFRPRFRVRPALPQAHERRGEVEGGKGRSRLERRFFIGAVVSPFKWTEGPAMMQYWKREKKPATGADFIVTQLGYDTRKFRELITYVRTELGSPVPLMGSAQVPTAGAAPMVAILRGLEYNGTHIERLASKVEDVDFLVRRSGRIGEDYPESRGPKGMRIGHCGGGRIDGGCEMFHERMCIWHHVYWRAKNRRAPDTLKCIIPPRNWKLYETSS